MGDTGHGHRTRPPLDGVPGTALWALHHRSAHLTDPVATAALERLGVPLDSFLGRRTPMMSHWFAERARLFDREITTWAAAHAGGTVVALGEGLETQFWRVDDGQLTWVTVDLPPVVELRRTVLPNEPRQRAVACSVTDPRWTDEVGDAADVLIVAQGLVMYLRPHEVNALISTCADRFPHGSVLFDSTPMWFTGLSRLGLLRCGPFRVPPMYFGMSVAGLHRLRDVRPRLRNIRSLRLEHIPGPAGFVHRAGHRIPLVRRLVPAVVRADFAA